MNATPLIRLLALSMLMASSLIAHSPCFAAERKPNIIFILADDLAMGDLGCYGQELIKTPNIDRMAAQGTRFTQCYSGTSVCAPSRASLMTGLHMGHCPIRANREVKPEGQLPLPAGTVTVAKILKDAGYATAVTGKWGMGLFDSPGSPLKTGFDHFYGYNCQRHAHSYFPSYLYNDDERFELEGNVGKGVGKVYAQNLIVEDTLNWIRRQKNQPFFLYFATTLPHGNYEIDDVGEYAKRDWTQQQKTYAAMVSRLDSDVGRLLDLLKEMNIDNDTIMFIAGDNGSSFDPNSELGKLFKQSRGLRGHKRSMYEGGLRQAAIVRWPAGVPAGKVRDEPWAFWDFLPTAADLAGAKLPEGTKIDGLSIKRLLTGGDAPKREYFYWELHEGKSIQALRFDDWKAVRNGPNAAIELYDLKTDEGERNDVAKAHADLVGKAHSLMQSARVDSADFPMRAAVPANKNKNKNEDKNK